MKLINKVDKQVLLALSAPVGFVIISAIFLYAFKALGLAMRLFIGIAIPIAAVFGSFLGTLFCQKLLKIKAPLLRLIIGVILGYEFGGMLFFSALCLQKVPFTKDLVYFCSLTMLLCGYLGGLIGQKFLPQAEEMK